MAFIDTGNYAVLRDALLSARPLTDAEKTVLRDELAKDPAGRGYKNKDGTFKAPSDLLRLLCERYAVENPDTRIRLARVSCTVDEFVKWTGVAMARALAAGDPLLTKWAGVAQIMLPFITAQNSIHLDVPETAGYIEQIVGDGLRTKEEAADLLSFPDPNYQATIEVAGRVEAVLGVALVPTLEEIAGLVA